MFESLIQPPAGVLPVQHEFVTIATDQFYSGVMTSSDADATSISSVHLSATLTTASTTINYIGATTDTPTPPSPK
jgi:hypothetical protein